MNTSEHQENISRIVWIAIIILVFSILYWTQKWVGVQMMGHVLETISNVIPK